jgi:hypothetical protein
LPAKVETDAAESEAAASRGRRRRRFIRMDDEG